MNINTSLKILMTPVWNESWILDTFLTVNSPMFDFIIIADQMSSDGSRQIAKGYKNVVIVDNTKSDFDEPHMRQIMLDAARDRFGPGNFLVALDADELLFPQHQSFLGLEKASAYPVGTRFRLLRRNLSPDLELAWSVDGGICGFIDDGSNFPLDGRIHAPRIPFRKDALVLPFPEGVEQLHLQFIDWQRMEAKHRWYRRWEMVNLGQLPIAVWRKYNHMNSIPSTALIAIELPAKLKTRLQQVASQDFKGEWALRIKSLEKRMSQISLAWLQILETPNFESKSLLERLVKSYQKITGKWSSPTHFQLAFLFVRVTDWLLDLALLRKRS